MEVSDMDFEAIKGGGTRLPGGHDPVPAGDDLPSQRGCEEKEVVHVHGGGGKLGFEKVEVDGLGNVIGWMGDGDKIIAIDSHIDTVGIGNHQQLGGLTPIRAMRTTPSSIGRGGSDQEGGMASAVYGAKIMKDLGLIPAGYKIMVVGSVQEEDCDGMCWQYIVNKYFPANGIPRSRWSSSSPPSPPTAASTAATGAAWRSAWT